MPFWGWLYKYYFRVETEGWHHIPTQKQVLLVGSHNGGLFAPDTILTMYDWFQNFGTERLVYGLMHPYAWKINPSFARLAEKTGAIEAHPKMAIAALKKNASVLVYPGGVEDVFRPHSQRYNINFAGRKGFIKLALKYQVPIVPIISTGAHDTLIILGDFYDIAQKLHQMGMPWLLDLDPQVFPIYLGLPWGVAFGPLPNIPFPIKIRTRVCSPIVFAKYGAKAAKDSQYVDACYDLVVSQMQEQLNDLAEVN